MKFTDKEKTRLEKFRDFFELVAPQKRRPERIALCSKMTKLRPASVYVYLSPGCKVQPSERALYIFEISLKKQKLI